MAREVPEIDRLIEEGLTLYGHGDLDGALARWERALAIDPDNAQANSYVEYVRSNYELLTNDVNGEATIEGPPFGINEDEPEYQIEIQPGEIKPSAPAKDAPVSIDPLDEGWFLDQETQSSRYDGPPPTDGRPSQEMTVELEADEPPQEQLLEMEADEPPERLPSSVPQAPLELEPPGVSFDDATREYQPRRAMSDPYGSFEQPTPQPGARDDFAPEATPAFGHPSDFQTPPGFGTQITGIKQREDLGFVKPTPPASATALGLPNPRAPAKSSVPPANEPGPPSIEITLEPPEPPSEVTTSKRKPLDLSADAPTNERRPISFADLDGDSTIQRQPFTIADLDSIAPTTAKPAGDADDDLISSLPSPRPAPQVPQIAKPATATTTRDFPVETRAPAFRARPQQHDVKPVISSTQTADFEAKTSERPASILDQTADIPTVAVRARPADPIVSAPTRDLGLRDVAAATQSVNEGTFDPIDARSAEIMEEVDTGAPRDEAKEDQTRRRITTLFDKAARWSGDGDLERAVAAVELALSEEPSSALAQKLIHRNRDTIMNVFQAYLGDLERTPSLARPLHELANAPISPRAAFLLSRIDGLISIDEILDVCGMPRLEAYRYLCQLFLRGILR